MPLTPYHLGPASLFGISLRKYLHIPTLLVSSVILDVEPFLVLFFELKSPLHSITHNFLAATIIAAPVAGIMYFFRSEIDAFMGLFHLEQKTTFAKMLLTSVIGTWSHVILDAFLYTDMYPFFPSKYDPFQGHAGMKAVVSFCVWSFVVATAWYAIYLLRRKEPVAGTSEEGPAK